MADLQHRTEDDDHAPIPAVTTPQGTLAHTVEHGHEEQDVNFAPLVKWTVILSALIVFSHVVSFGFYRVLEDTGAPKEPASVFGKRVTPPEPRLLPNPADTKYIDDAPSTALRGYETLEGPGAYGQAELAREADKLAQLGFYNRESGLPEVPENVVQSVREGTTSSGTQGDGLSEIMPSDPSGGTGMENRLR